MFKDFLYLREWLVREQSNAPSGMVVLECIRSRSGMSMGVYDRGERIFTVNGCGFDRVGVALAEFLETCFRDELLSLTDAEADAGATPPLSTTSSYHYCERFPALHFEPLAPFGVSLEGATGVNSMIEVANAIGLSVHLSESKAGTLIIITKKGA